MVVLSLNAGPPAGLLNTVLASLLVPRILLCECTPMFPSGQMGPPTHLPAVTEHRGIDGNSVEYAGLGIPCSHGRAPFSNMIMNRPKTGVNRSGERVGEGQRKG